MRAYDQTTAEQTAFVRAIRENPDDDTARLVYADWLQEHGDEARARYVRLEVRLAKTQRSDPEHEELCRRSLALRSKYGGAWDAEVLCRRPRGVRGLTYRRGFAERVSASAYAFIHRGGSGSSGRRSGRPT